MGQALSSISILAIAKFGWRGTYGIMGACGVIVSAMIAFLVKEPERGRFLSEKEKEKVRLQKEEELQK